MQITAASTNAGLTAETAAKLESQHSGIRFVIPEVTKVIRILPVGETDEAGFVSVSLLPTVPGDPQLEFYNADVLTENRPGIVLSRFLAESLNLDFVPVDGRFAPRKSDQTVTFQISREGPNGLEVFDGTLPVAAIAEFAESSVAYVHWSLMDQLESFH